MEDLKKALYEYKVLTEDIISSLEQDAYYELECLLEKREEIISLIGNLEYSAEEFKEISEELNLLQLENKLNEIFKEKHLRLKTIIATINTAKTANNAYNKLNYTNSAFFNKKI